MAATAAGAARAIPGVRHASACLTLGCTLVPEAYTIDIHLGPADLEAALRRDVLRGLTASPKHLPPKWHYDERGSALFDAITRLPEYYLTRCERIES